MTYLFSEFGVGRIVSNKHHAVVYIRISMYMSK